MKRVFCVTILLLVLAGCKIPLYSGLLEKEANEMIGLLISRGIAVEKIPEKTGRIALQVSESDFATSVEVLRQAGFPRQKRLGIEEMFPSNQLVSSPIQERAKLNFLREQQIATMISSMDGVIDANVTISQKAEESSGKGVRPSASVVVVYSAEANLQKFEPQIRHIIKESVPGVDVSDISLVLHPSQTRYPVAVERGRSDQHGIQLLKSKQHVLLVGAVGCGIFVTAGMYLLYWRRRRQRGT